MKLNNKGFAFSTMLYGTLAIITLVLYAILNISKSSTDTTYYYGDIIKSKLNECVSDELQLENCNSSSNANCNRTPFLACLGVSDNTSTFTGIIASEKLKETVVTAGNGLYEYKRDNEPKKYIYRGTNVDNYIQYSGKMWRIISVESNGYLKLIDINNPIELKWDNNSGSSLEYKGSTMANRLESQYKASITDPSKLQKIRWEVVYIYPSIASSPDAFTMDDYYKLRSEEYGYSLTPETEVGVLTIEEYLAASLVSECQTNLLQSTGCTSWLANYKGWTMNLSAENSENSSENYAFYFSNNNGIATENVTTSMNVYPVIYLNRNVVINGNGTQTNPYLVQ